MRNAHFLFFTSEQPKRFNLWSSQKVCDANHYLLDTIFVRFGLKMYMQNVGIPKGTHRSPLIADLFLVSYERETSCCLFLTIIKLMMLKHLTLHSMVSR